MRNQLFVLLLLLGLSTAITACDFGGNQAEEQEVQEQENEGQIGTEGEEEEGEGEEGEEEEGGDD